MSESRKIADKSTAKFERHIQNAPKHDPNMKITQKSQTCLRNGSKITNFQKTMSYRSPGKVLEIVDFDEKSRNLQCKNPKDVSKTRQSPIKMWIGSGKIVENRPKVENSRINQQHNSKDTEGTLHGPKTRSNSEKQTKNHNDV